MKKTKLNLTEAFRVFDNNNTGSISRSEFHDVLDQLVEDMSFEEKENLLKAADKNNDGSIDFEEFSALFSDIDVYNQVREAKRNVNMRQDLFSLIEKAYENDIDLEKEFLKYD